MISGVILSMILSHGLERTSGICEAWEWSCKLDLFSINFFIFFHAWFSSSHSVLLCVFQWDREVHIALWWWPSISNTVLIPGHFYLMSHSHLTSAKGRLVTPLVSYGKNPQDNAFYETEILPANTAFWWYILMSLLKLWIPDYWLE